MNNKFRGSEVIRKTLIGTGIWVLGHTSAVACNGDFYVAWLEAEASTQMYVRSVLVDAAGVNDQYGIMNLADDTAAGINPSYIHNMAVHAFMNNTSLFITTDDTDCVIDNDGENLGNVTDIQPGN